MEKPSGKTISALLVFLLIASFIVNIYQNSIINKHKKSNDAERSKVLIAATEAFKQDYKERSGDNVNANFLNRCKYSVVYNNETSSWLVSFSYKEVEGSPATTVYTFSVKNNYVAKYESVSQSGGL